MKYKKTIAIFAKMINDTDLFIFMDDNSDLFDITKMCKVLT